MNFFVKLLNIFCKFVIITKMNYFERFFYLVMKNLFYLKCFSTECTEYTPYSSHLAFCHGEVSKTKTNILSNITTFKNVFSWLSE